MVQTVSVSFFGDYTLIQIVSNNTAYQFTFTQG